MEDFFGEKVETIYVSTIHKAKGREFDNVFLLLDQFTPVTNEAKRQLYVAMTRAKRCLTIHYNGNYLDFIKTDDLIKVDDRGHYPSPNQLAMQLTYKDVWLDFFLPCQPLISQLKCGDLLNIDGNGCSNSKGQLVLRFSKNIINQINSVKKNNYVPKSARIRFIVYWQKENSDKEIRIILPELHFERT